jgi:adenylate kinase
MADQAPQVIVLGPPGAGKGTQAERLAARLGLVHVNPGHILRDGFRGSSPSGQRIRREMAAGELLPDDLVDSVVRERLEKLAPEQGFVLDGYPRTPGQAATLRRMLAELGRLQRRTVVVWLDVPREVLVQRLRRRRDVEGRPDDAEGAIVRRLEIDAAQAGAARDALARWADVVTIDGDRPADAVTDDILDRVGSRAPAASG